MVGAPSHIDTFDPKPALDKYDGQLLPPSYGTVISEFTKGDTPLLKSPWKFKKYGQCGRDVSSLVSATVAQHVDDMCFVRSFFTESTVHAPAMYQVNTGRILMGYPSMGSWVTYGLGQRKRESSGVCGDAAAGRNARRRSSLLGSRIPAGGLPGHGISVRARARS